MVRMLALTALLVLSCVCLSLSASEVVADTAAAVVPATKQDWMTMVATILGTLITIFILPLLKNKAAEAQAKAQGARYDASQSLMAQKNYLIDARLIPFLLNTAAYLTEVRLPQWIDRIGRRDFDGIWNDLVLELKDLAIKKFAVEGIDLVATIGPDALTSLIKRAVIEKLPIPNGIKDPAGYLIDKVVPLLATKGVEWVRERIEFGEDPSSTDQG